MRGRPFLKIARSALLEKTYLTTFLIKPYTGNRIVSRVFLFSGPGWGTKAAVFFQLGAGPGNSAKHYPQIVVSFAKALHARFQLPALFGTLGPSCRDLRPPSPTEPQDLSTGCVTNVLVARGRWSASRANKKLKIF